MAAMSMIVEVPEPLAAQLAAEAARRGVSIDQLTVEALQDHLNVTHDPTPESLAGFVGSFDSGDPDWAGTDTHTLRADTATRRTA